MSDTRSYTRVRNHSPIWRASSYPSHVAGWSIFSYEMRIYSHREKELYHGLGSLDSLRLVSKKGTSDHVKNGMERFLSASIQESLWKGSLPIRLEEFVEEGSRKEDLPLFLLTFREACLGTVSKSFLSHLGYDANAFEDVALSFYDENDVPIVSNVPVGVVYDVMDVKDKPWKLKVRVERNEHCKDAVKLRFFNALKASSYASIGSAQPIIAMRTDEAERLWSACISGDFLLYKSTARSFHEKMRLAERFLVRVYCRTNDTKHASGADWWKDHVESVLRVVDLKGQGELPVDRVLASWLRPELDLQKAEVVVAGIQCPMEVTMEQLWRLMRAPDYTLYITVRWTAG